jgi:hypothetical protein
MEPEERHKSLSELTPTPIFDNTLEMESKGKLVIMHVIFKSHAVTKIGVGVNSHR